LKLILLNRTKKVIASIVHLNRLLIGLGVVAVFLGGMLCLCDLEYIHSSRWHTLLKVVRALDKVTTNYPSPPHVETELRQGYARFRQHADTLQRNEEQRKHLENELRQAQKMDALGRLGSGVANDFQQFAYGHQGQFDIALDRKLAPTTLFRGNCEQIGKVAEEPPPSQDNYLPSADVNCSQPKVLDLKISDHGSSRLLKRLLREDIEFGVRAWRVSGRVLADPGQNRAGPC